MINNIQGVPNVSFPTRFMCVFSLLRRHRLSIIGQNFLQAKKLIFMKYVNYEMPAEEASVYYSIE